MMGWSTGAQAAERRDKTRRPQTADGCAGRRPQTADADHRQQTQDADGRRKTQTADARRRRQTLAQAAEHIDKMRRP
jgi:hypothetical protein